MTPALGREANGEGDPEEVRRIIGEVSIIDQARKRAGPSC
jgi:hypothetical protein